MTSLMHLFGHPRRRGALGALAFVLLISAAGLGSALAQPTAEAELGQRMRLTPEQRRELWERMTPEQREKWRSARSAEERQHLWGDMPRHQRHEMWDQMSPEQRELMLRRVPSDQRSELWRRMTPQERDAMRQRFVERRSERGPDGYGGPRKRHALSPEERHRLREQIDEARRDVYRRPDRKGGRR